MFYRVMKQWPRRLLTDPISGEPFTADSFTTVLEVCRTREAAEKVRRECRRDEPRTRDNRPIRYWIEQRDY